MKEIQLSERMIPRTVCRSGSFNRRTTSRPILSIQLNDCVRFKLQDSSSDSQSNLDQRKEERELLAAEQALLAAVSSKYLKCRQARPVLRRPAPALLRRRSNSVTPMDGLWTSSNDKADPKSLPGPARLYCLRRTGIFQTQALLPSHRRRLCPLHSHRPPLKSRVVPPSVSSAPPHPRFQALLHRRSRLQGDPCRGSGRRRYDGGGWGGGWSGARRTSPTSRLSCRLIL